MLVRTHHLSGDGGAGSAATFRRVHGRRGSLGMEMASNLNPDIFGFYPCTVRAIKYLHCTTVFAALRAAQSRFKLRDRPVDSDAPLNVHIAYVACMAASAHEPDDELRRNEFPELAVFVDL